jgi:hypothetical protein
MIIQTVQIIISLLCGSFAWFIQPQMKAQSGQRIPRMAGRTLSLLNIAMSVMIQQAKEPREAR